MNPFSTNVNNNARQNQILLVLSVLAILFSFGKDFLSLPDWSFLRYAGPFATWLPLILILANSTFFDDKWNRRIFPVFLAINGLAAAFKILHWPGANELLIVGLIGFTLYYWFRFFRKSPKGLLDVLKVLWISAHLPNACLKLLREDRLDPYLSYVGEGLLWLMFLVFLYDGFKRGIFGSWKLKAVSDEDNTIPEESTQGSEGDL